MYMHNAVHTYYKVVTAITTVWAIFGLSASRSCAQGPKVDALHASSAIKLEATDVLYTSYDKEKIDCLSAGCV